MNAPRAFIALPEYPGVKRDMAFFVDSKTQYSDVMKCMTNADSLVTGVELFDIYQGKGVPDNKKSMAFHITYRSNHKTLSMEEADEAHKKVENSLVKYCKAQVRK